MEPISNERIEEIKKRSNAARPAPWKSYIEERDHDSGSDFIMVGEEDSRSEDIELIGATVEDQDFIAHAREDILLLLSEIERLKTRMENGGQEVR